MLNRLKNTLPSRGWMLFWTVFGSVPGAIFYDKYRIKSIIKEHQAKASQISKQSAEWNTPNRKIIVLIDPNQWASYWFEYIVKPILDAGAIDYELIERDYVAQIIESTRDIIWNAKEMHQKMDELRKIKPKQGWFGPILTPEQEEEAKQNMIQKITPHLYKPIYNPSHGIVTMGPNAWRHILYGIQLGSFTKPDKKSLDETRPESNIENIPNGSIQYPTLGYISTKSHSFPFRIVNWFTKRFIAEDIAKETIKIVYGNYREFEPKDTLLGTELFSPSPIENEKDAKVKDRMFETWTQEAEEFTLDPLISSRLTIYD